MIKYFVIFLSLLLLATANFAQNDKGVGVKSNSTTKKRLALVIGNADYRFGGKLFNTVNDSSDMRRILQLLDFTVMGEDNMTADQMKKAIKDFGKELSKGGIGLFYFSGHGIQANGRNYLIPVDAPDDLREDTLEFEAVDVNRVLGEMAAAKNGFNIVILDACRNNPFAKGWRDANGGLAQIKAPTGTLIAYATAPDTTASDGKKRNGTYTEKLLKRIIIPNQTIEQIFKDVSRDVFDETNGRQDPWYASSLKGDFYFSGSGNSIIKINPIIETNITQYIVGRGKNSEKILFTFGSNDGKKISPLEIYQISGELRDSLIYKLKEKGLTVILNSGLTKNENSQYLGGINSRTDEKALHLLPVALIFNVTIQVLEDMPQYQGMFISKVSGFIEIIDTANNKTIGIERFSEVRGFGNTQDQARRNALKNAGEGISSSFFDLVKEKSR